MNTKTVFLLCLLVIAPRLSFTGMCIFNSMISDSTCTKCPQTSTSNCAQTFTSSALQGYAGSSLSTIGTWFRLDTALSTQINVFALTEGAPTTKTSTLQSVWVNSDSTATIEYRASSGTNQQDIKPTNKNTGKWVFYYSSVSWASSALSGYFGIYDPSTHASPSGLLLWTSTAITQSYTMGSNIQLTFSAFFTENVNAPCVTMSGAFAIPYYIADPDPLLKYLGNHKPTILVHYNFYNPANQTVTDFSGVGSDGILGTTTSAEATYDPLYNSTMPGWQNGVIFAGTQTINVGTIDANELSNVSESLGFYFFVNFSSETGCQGTLLTIRDSTNAEVLTFFTTVNTDSTVTIRAGTSSSSVPFSISLPTEEWLRISITCRAYGYSIDCYLRSLSTDQHASLRVSQATLFPSGGSAIIGDKTCSFRGTLRNFITSTGSTAVLSSTENCNSSCTDQIGHLNPICSLPASLPAFCLPQEYSNQLLNTCLLCPPACKTCNKNGICTSCQAGSYYSPTSPTGCATCPASCPTCTSASYCLSCSSNLFLKDGQCSSTCPNGYYADTYNNTCSSCDGSCKTCFGSTSDSCLSCDSGLILYKNSCLISCPVFSVYSNETQSCVSCDETCLTCNATGPNGCLACNQGLYLLGTTCVETCPSDYYYTNVNYGDVQVPSCLQKVNLTYYMTTTNDPNTILITFSQNASTFISTMSSYSVVTIDGVNISNSQFSFVPIETSSSRGLKVLLVLDASVYAEKGAQLNLSFELGSDYNDDSYSGYVFKDPSAIVALREVNQLSEGQEKVYQGAGAAMDIIGLIASFGQVLLILLTTGHRSSIVRYQIACAVSQIHRMMAIDWPSGLQEFFRKSSFDPCSFVIPIFVRGPYGHSTNGSITYDGEYEKLSTFVRDRGANPDFLNNFSFQLIGVSSVVVLILTNKILRHFSDKGAVKHHIFFKIGQRLESIDGILQFNAILIYLYTLTLPGMFFSLLQFFEAPHVGSQSWSLTLAVFTFLALIGLVMHSYFEVSRKLRAEKDEWLIENNCLSGDYKSDRKIQRFYIPINLTRTIIIALIMSVMSSIPAAQAALSFIINLTFLAYVILRKPLIEKWNNRLAIVMESIVVFSNICVLGIVSMKGTQGNLGARLGFGAMFLVCGLGLTILAALATLVQLFMRLRAGSEVGIAPANRAAPIARQKMPAKAQKFKIEEDEFTVESTWAFWRKAIVFTPREEWLKPENKEKLQEIINWTNTFFQQDEDKSSEESVNLLNGSKVDENLPSHRIEISHDSPEKLRTTATTTMSPEKLSRFAQKKDPEA